MANRYTTNRTRTFKSQRESFKNNASLSVSRSSGIRHKQTHTYFNSDNITTKTPTHKPSHTSSLRMNIGAKLIRNRPYSQHTTPITPQFTNNNNKFIDLKRFRTERGDNHNRLRLKQAQTDNYYNTTNSFLPKHHYSHSTMSNKRKSRKHHQQNMTMQVHDDNLGQHHHQRLEIDHEESPSTPQPTTPSVMDDDDTDNESMIITDAYRAYHPQVMATSFPDTESISSQRHHHNTSTLTTQSKQTDIDIINELREEITKLTKENVSKSSKIDELVHVVNISNISTVTDYSDDDGMTEMTDEGITDDDEDERKKKIEKLNRRSNKYSFLTDNGWIHRSNKSIHNHMDHMYGSNRSNSRSMEFKMSELFEQTAEKFIAFLKDAEAKEAEKDKIIKLEAKEKEKIMLDLHEKVTENEKLLTENMRLTHENKKLKDQNMKNQRELQELRAMRQSLNNEIVSAQKTIAQQKEVIRGYNLRQFEQQYPQTPLDEHQRSVTDNVSIDLSAVFTAVHNETEDEDEDKDQQEIIDRHTSTTSDANGLLSVPRFTNNRSVPTPNLKQQELELYQLFKSFIDDHKIVNVNNTEQPRYSHNVSNSSTQCEETKENVSMSIEEENLNVYDERDIISYKIDGINTLETPRSLNNDQSIPSTQLTLSKSTTDSIEDKDEHDIDHRVSHDIDEEEDDFTQDEDEEYKLNNMDKQDSKDSVDSGSLPDINRLKSQTYWNRAIYETQTNPTRHHLATSRKYIEQGRVANMAKIFQSANPNPLPPSSLAALSNLPEQPDTLIRQLSHKTKTQITSTRSKRTNGPKHKHKRKPKNVRKYQLDQSRPKHDQQYENMDNMNMNMNKPIFDNKPSWRTLVNKRNSARCKSNAERVSTPRGSLINHKGKITVDKKSLIKVTEMLKKDKFFDE